MNTTSRAAAGLFAAVVVLSLAPRAHAQPFGLFANAFLDSSRTPVTRITVEVPFRTLVFLKKEGFYDARYDAYISVRRAGEGNAPPTTYVIHGSATVKTYDETRRRDQKSRSWRQIKLAPGDYEIEALLTVKNTGIGMRRSVTLRVPDFLASGMAFGTPAVMSVPVQFKKTFARWVDVEDELKAADTPPDASIAGFERQPAVRFALFLDNDAAAPCDVFYEVVDPSDHQVAYGKRRVNLTGKDDEFMVAFNVDTWSPGLYKVNLRARTLEPQRDATTSADIRIDVTRAMLGADFDATMEMLGLIASASDLKALRAAPETERAAEWNKFWTARDPDPSTDENEALAQHLTRVQHVAREFSQFGPGWKSDRGRVYIRYGPPEQIDTAMDQRAQGEYEIWRYYTQNRSFVFFDMFGVGDFKLVEGEL